MSEEPLEQAPLVINGRRYPMWSQFVHRKAEWIGGVLEDFGECHDGRPLCATEIVDIKLEPNGKEHAWFEVTGKDFTCGFCTSVGGVIGGAEGWLTVSGYQGHTWRFKQAVKKPAEPTLL